jgi:hypothetical protein
MPERILKIASCTLAIRFSIRQRLTVLALQVKNVPKSAKNRPAGPHGPPGCRGGRWRACWTGIAEGRMCEADDSVCSCSVVARRFENRFFLLKSVDKFNNVVTCSFHGGEHGHSSTFLGKAVVHKWQSRRKAWNRS